MKSINLLKQQKMFALVEQLRREGGTMVGFCRKHDLSVSSLKYWQKVYGNQNGGTTTNRATDKVGKNKGEKNAFVKIPIPKAEMGKVELLYPNGVRLLVDILEPERLSALIKLWD